MESDLIFSFQPLASGNRYFVRQDDFVQCVSIFFFNLAISCTFYFRLLWKYFLLSNSSSASYFEHFVSLRQQCFQFLTDPVKPATWLPVLCSSVSAACFLGASFKFLTLSYRSA